MANFRSSLKYELNKHLIVNNNNRLMENRYTFTLP